MDDSPFGTRKARSSFGRGFFKIKSNKRTASAPNLGMWQYLGPELGKEGKTLVPPRLSSFTDTFLILRKEEKSAKNASVDLVCSVKISQLLPHFCAVKQTAARK